MQYAIKILYRGRQMYWFSVKYVKRNALTGRRLGSWEAVWLKEWAVTVADQRVHGTTHERTALSFSRVSARPA